MNLFLQFRFCIDEWKSGTFKMATFSEKAIADEYKIHIKDLKEWSSGNPVVVTKIRMKMFDRAV